MLEEFNSLPDRLVTYVNEQNVASLAQAAVLADEYVLTHKHTFVVPARSEGRVFMPSARDGRDSRDRKESPTPFPGNVGLKPQECFYCHQPGHMIADCNMYKRKQIPPVERPKEVGLVQTLPLSVADGRDVTDSLDPSYHPFVFDGTVSITGSGSDQHPVRILRDTGAAQSFLLASALSLSADSACGSSVLVQGIEMGFVSVPLHRVHLQCSLVAGVFRVGVRPSLPVKGVTFILGNDIAGGQVVPVLEVLEHPDTLQSDVLEQEYPGVFPVCAVTRAQSRKMGDVVGLSDTFLRECWMMRQSPPLFPRRLLMRTPPRPRCSCSWVRLAVVTRYP